MGVGGGRDGMGERGGWKLDLVQLKIVAHLQMLGVPSEMKCLFI